MVPKITVYIHNSITPYNAIFKELNKRGLYKKELLYAGMNSEDIPELLKTGSLESRILGWDTAHISSMNIFQKIKNKNPASKPFEFVYVGTEEDIKKTGHAEIDPWLIANRYPTPALAVYDHCKLQSPELSMGRPIDDGLKTFHKNASRLTALTAILVITYEPPKNVWNGFGLFLKK